MIAEIVYILCGITACVCTVLLLRRYVRTRVPLLLWSGLAFLFIAAANLLLFVDMVIMRQNDLALLRNCMTLCGLLLLLYALLRTEN